MLWLCFDFVECHSADLRKLHELVMLHVYRLSIDKRSAWLEEMTEKL